MEKWEFRPLESIGKISFGMKREDVHKLFKENCKEFKKTKFSKNTTDDYGKFHVFYTVDNQVEAVEIFSNIEVIFEGTIVYPAEIKEVEAVLGNLIEDAGSYIQMDKSVGIYAPEYEAESILLGMKGYY